jgi:hypothetical protein
MNNARFFVDNEMVGDPISVCNGLDETKYVTLIDFKFDDHHFRRVKRLLILLNECNIRPCVDMTFDDDMIETRHICLRTIGKDPYRQEIPPWSMRLRGECLR